MNIVLIILAVFTGIILVLFALLWLRLLQIQLLIANFFYQEDEKTPSSFARLMQDLAVMIGRSAAMEIKTTLMGKASGEARLEQGIQADMLNDQVAQDNPALSLILDSFPTLKKRAFKNPAVLELLLSKLGNTGGGSSGNSGMTTGSYSARLNKYR